MRTETMRCADPEEKPAVKTTIMEDDAAAKRAAKLWAREKEGKAKSGTWTWWTDGSRTDAGKVGAAAGCLNGDHWTVFRSFLDTGRMEVFDAELWAIAVALRMSVINAKALRAHGVTTVGIFSDLHAAIRRTAHLDPGPGQQLARAINEHARALRTHAVEVVIQWIPGHSGIPGNEETDRQANKTLEDRSYTAHERKYTSAANRARRISERSMEAKAEWDAEKCYKHYSYRLKDKAGSKRPVPMSSMKSLAARFYRMKSGHALTGTYLKRFRHREDDKCWWCREGMLQTREHLLRHCSRWKDQQKALWTAVGKATG
jgi:ribonuclease HI